MCEHVMISYGPFMQHRCVREEPHEPRLGCVYETRRMAVIREIRELLNVPDRYDVDVLISTTSDGSWYVATASSYGVPLSPADWDSCVRAGLPMAKWDGPPLEAWVRSFRRGMGLPARMTGARRHVDVCDRNHGPEEACTTGEGVPPAVDALAAAVFDSEQRARCAELEAQRATEKYVSAVETLAEARAMLVKLEPVLVAAEALVGTWESGGISHRLGAHLHDLKAAIDGAPVPDKVVWLDRMPTSAEVEAHAKAHPVGFDRGGAWVRVFAEGVDIVWLHVYNGHIGRTQNDFPPSHQDGDRWRPVTAEGDPAPMPPVAQ